MTAELHACGDCGRLWTALGEAHCAGCCRHFSSDSAFDAHLVGLPPHGPLVETCRDPATVRTRDGRPRLVLAEGRHGPTWSRPGSDPRRGHPQEGGAPGAPARNTGGNTPSTTVDLPTPVTARSAAAPGLEQASR